MKFISHLLLTIAILASCGATAADDQAPAQLRKQLDAMTSLQGDFVQTLYDPKGKQQDESKGTFVMMRPGKFYWKTLTPAPQLLVSNQKTIWLYDPDLETVHIRPFSDDLQKTPTLLLTADIETLRKHFSIKRSQQANNVETFALTPKVTDGLFQKLTLVFVEGMLMEFNIEDSLGQLSKIILSKQKRNQPIDEVIFTFIPPAGVDIINNQ